MDCQRAVISCRCLIHVWWFIKGCSEAQNPLQVPAEASKRQRKMSSQSEKWLARSMLPTKEEVRWCTVFDVWPAEARMYLYRPTCIEPQLETAAFWSGCNSLQRLLEGVELNGYLLPEDFKTHNQRFWALQTQLTKAWSNKRSTVIILSKEKDDKPGPVVVSPKKRVRKQ